MRQLRAGIDAGKSHHHCVVIDAGGARLLSRRVANDEAELIGLIDAVTALAGGGEVTWAIDLNTGGAALAIALLTERGQTLLYLPGRIVYHASAGYRGDGKTDAKDAAIIADQARMRRDLHPMRTDDEISVELRILTSHRTDLMRDRTRSINRLRSLLSTYFPALERALDISNTKAALILLTGYRTPDGLRRIGQVRLESWLRKRKTYNAAKVAATALAAANAQHVRVPGQDVAAATVGKLTEQIMALDAELAEVDASIEGRFRRHHHAAVIESMPGSVLCWVPSSSPLSAVTSRCSPARIVLLLSPDWPRCRGIRAASAATTAGPGATTADCSGCSTCRRSSASDPAPSPRPTMTANAAKGNATPRRFSRWQDAGRTSCGQCCATTPSISQHPPSLRRRDREIWNGVATTVDRSTTTVGCCEAAMYSWTGLLGLPKPPHVCRGRSRPVW